jgi:hypothetical protein
MWGGYYDHSAGTTITAPLPSGVPGAARFLANTGVGGVIELPDARLLPVGGPIYVVWAETNCSVNNGARGTLATLTLDQVGKFFLLDNSTEAGTWIVETTTGAHSTAQTIAVDEFTIEFGPGLNLAANIRTMCDQLGYEGTDPARVNVFVGPQGSATVGAVGSTSTSIPGMRTGTFPAGSKIILTVLENGYITGRGGRGGEGQPITGGTTGSPTYGTVGDGEDGGDGLHVECDTILFNYGRIQGGGGGGAGGDASGSISGPGGGGGAGHKFGPRGPTGTIPPNQGFGFGGNALIGVLNEGGLGGGVNNGAPAGTGGTGGGPGQNGNAASPSGGVVGTAGFAIRVAAGVTLTKAVAGTIEGFEGAL